MLRNGFRIEHEALCSEITFLRGNFSLQSKELQFKKVQEQKTLDKFVLLQDQVKTQSQKAQMAQENTLKIESKSKEQITQLQNVIDQNNQQL